MVTSNSPSKLLRRTLQANAAFSALSGIIAIASAKPLSLLLGVNVSSLLIGMGIALLAYAAVLFLNARRENIKLQEAWLAVVLDAAWVIGSAILIFAGTLSTTGNWLIAIVAKIVLIFAVLQFFGIRRLQQQKPAKATTVLLLGFVIFMLGSIVNQAAALPTADLRTKQLKQAGYTASLAQQGRELLQRVAERHGLAAWRNYQTAEMIAVDEWAANADGWWPIKLQRLKTQALLRTFTSRVELLNGDAKGEIFGIQSWQGYKKVNADAPISYSDDRVLTFYLPALQYFDELPFRLLSAEFIVYAGEKSHRGKNFHLIYATWGNFTPNLQHDQYLLWISQETLLVEMCLYTVRDLITWGTGTIHFEDYREVQGVRFPFKQTVVLPRPEATVYPLDENFFHRLTFEEVKYDVFDKQVLIIVPNKAVGDFKPSR